ncbi:MAG: hypothetical protein LCH31_01210, partial [Actinobacteria bacterium]|nr:hypothetical protein [Actinomycetota bacterium]
KLAAAASLASALETHAELIKGETLAAELTVSSVEAPAADEAASALSNTVASALGTEKAPLGITIDVHGSNA